MHSRPQITPIHYVLACGHRSLFLFVVVPFALCHHLRHRVPILFPSIVRTRLMCRHLANHHHTQAVHYCTQMILTLPFCPVVQRHLITLVHHPTMWVIDAQTLCPHPTPRKQRLRLPPAVASVVHHPSIHARRLPPPLLLPLTSPTLHRRSMTFYSQVNHFPGSSVKKRATVVMCTTMTVTRDVL